MELSQNKYNLIAANVLQEAMIKESIRYYSNAYPKNPKLYHHNFDYMLIHDDGVTLYFNSDNVMQWCHTIDIKE